MSSGGQGFHCIFTLWKWRRVRVLFQHKSLWAPKYHFAESTTRVVPNCSKNGRVEFCVMKSHIRKQSLSKPLSSYKLRIYNFSTWAPTGSQISLCRFHEESVSKLLPENKAVTLGEEFRAQKEVSQKLLSRFELMIFPLSPQVSMRFKEVLLRFLKNTDSGVLYET